MASTSRYSSSIARAAWHLPQGSSIERAWHLPEGSGIERHAHGMCMHAHGICMACAWHVLPDRDRHEIAMRSTPLYPAGGRARRRCTGRPDQRQHRLQGHRQVDHTAGGATLPHTPHPTPSHRRTRSSSSSPSVPTPPSPCTRGCCTPCTRPHPRRRPRCAALARASTRCLSSPSDHPPTHPPACLRKVIFTHPRHLPVT